MTTKRQSLANIQNVVESRIVANNTFQYTTQEGDTVYRLHNTDIITYHADGERITLNTGGWKTPTTKDRMNKYLPAGHHIWQEEGIWYLHTPEWTIVFPQKELTWNLAQKEPPANAMTRKSALRLKKLVNAYMVKVRGLVKANKLPKPSPGDCFICQCEPGLSFRSPDADPLKDNGHIISHLEEKYVHGHLIYNALKWAGYRDEQMSYVYGGDTSVRCLRRYLKFRIGMAS